MRKMPTEGKREQKRGGGDRKENEAGQTKGKEDEEEERGEA